MRAHEKEILADLVLRIAIFVVAGMLSTACGGNASAPSNAPPASPAPSPPPTSLTVSGMVLEHTGAGSRPLPGLRLQVRTWQPPGSIFEVTSDASGRYQVADLPIGITVTVSPSLATAYRAPCPAGADVLKGNGVFDVHVVSAALLSTNGTPSSVPRSSVWVPGVVSEPAAEGGRPLAGVSAELTTDDSDTFVMSATFTDAAGRYLLCTAPPGVGTDQYAWVRLRKDGYQPTSRRVVMGFAEPTNLELARATR